MPSLPHRTGHIVPTMADIEERRRVAAIAALRGAVEQYKEAHELCAALPHHIPTGVWQAMGASRTAHEVHVRCLIGLLNPTR